MRFIARIELPHLSYLRLARATFSTQPTGLANQPDTVRSPALSESRVLSRRSLGALSLALSPLSLPRPTFITSSDKTSAVRSRVRDKFRFGAEQQAGTGSNVQ